MAQENGARIDDDVCLLNEIWNGSTNETCPCENDGEIDVPVIETWNVI